MRAATDRTSSSRPASTTVRRLQKRVGSGARCGFACKLRICARVADLRAMPRGGASGPAGRGFGSSRAALNLKASLLLVTAAKRVLLANHGTSAVTQGEKRADRRPVARGALRRPVRTAQLLGQLAPPESVRGVQVERPSDDPGRVPRPASRVPRPASRVPRPASRVPLPATRVRRRVPAPPPRVPRPRDRVRRPGRSRARAWGFGSSEYGLSATTRASSAQVRTITRHVTSSSAAIAFSRSAASADVWVPTTLSGHATCTYS